MKDKISIIIPNKNNLQVLKNCLESILKYPSKKSIVEIIVVDNGSNEETKNYLRNLKEIKLIDLPSNLGFGGAINTAIINKIEKSDVIVLNNDTIVTENWIDCLSSKAYENEKYGIVAPVLLYPDGKIQSSGGFMLSHGWGMHNLDMPTCDRETEYAPAACIYVKEALIKKLNNKIFDEDFYPAYSEDVWLGHEARKNGYVSIITPEVKIFHLEGQTSKDSTILSDKEKYELHQSKLKNRDKLYEKLDTVDNTENKKYKVAFVGTVRGGWSYASVLRNLSKALDRTKEVDVAIFDPDYHTFQGEPDWELSKMLSKPKDMSRISIRYSEGSQMFLSFGNRKIGYTTHESVTTIPKDWVYQLNQLNQVWTTTNYVRKIFINSGVKKPIHVIPHGINFDIYNPFGKKAKLSNTKGFIFYINNIYGRRKNIDHIIKAYVDEFTCDDNVTLLTKCNFNAMLKPSNTLEYFSQFERKDGKTPKIELVENWVDEETQARLYRASDCFIGVGNEGFGMSSQEALACGVPTIAPSYGGLTDFCTKENSLILERMAITPARQDFIFKQYANTHWAVPDIMEIREKMRFAYENQEHMKELGKNAYESVKHMTWDWVAEKCVNAIKLV
jgi:hypothetical protein